MPEFDDDKGIGLVLLNTEKGENIFSVLDMEIRQSSLDDARYFNGGFKENIAQPSKRTSFFAELNKGNSVENAVNKALQMSFFVKLKRNVKRIIKYFIRKIGL